MRVASVILILAWPIATAAAGQTPGAVFVAPAPPSFILAQRSRTCKDVSSCREAVELWCGGYRRADRDKDGVPCENVCPSKDLVDQIRTEIGC